jgi:hypothetical protein
MTRSTVKTIGVVLGCALPLIVDAQPSPSFSCTIGGASLSSTSPPTFTIGRGSLEQVPPDADPVQVFTGASPSEPLTIVIKGDATSPSAPGKELRVTFTIRGVTKNLLAKLPLTAPVELPGRAQTKGPAATVRLSYGPTAYEGARGHVAIDAIDFAAQTIRGNFNLTTGQSFDQQPPIQLTNGRFER